MLRTRFHLYSYTSQEDQQTRPGKLPIKSYALSHIGDEEE